MLINRLGLLEREFLRPVGIDPLSSRHYYLKYLIIESSFLSYILWFNSIGPSLRL